MDFNQGKKKINNLIVGKNYICRALMLCLCVIVWAGNVAYGAIRVTAEEGTSSVMQESVGKTVGAFNQILQEYMNISLEDDVEVIICPTRAIYTQILQDKLGNKPEDAKKYAQSTGGMASRKFHRIALNGETQAMTGGGNIASTVAHELFHEVQYQLAQDNAETAFKWMREGTADLVGTLVAEKLGFQSMKKWQIDRVNTLRTTPNPVTSNEVFNMSTAQWAALSEQKRAPYQVADLMVFFLIEQDPGGAYGKVVNYFQGTSREKDSGKNFETVFGMSRNEFFRQYMNWYGKKVLQDAAVEVEGYNLANSKTIGVVEDAVNSSRKFFFHSWGEDINLSLRLIITDSKATYEIAMRKEFGLPETDAKKNSQTTTWWYSGATVVMDMGTVVDKSTRFYNTGYFLGQKYCDAKIFGIPLARTYWLWKGVPQYVAGRIALEGGGVSVERRRELWLEVLRQGKGTPDLAGMDSSANWSGLLQKGLSREMFAVTGLATTSLVRRCGEESLHEWLRVLSVTKDENKAFLDAFGLTIDEFQREFQGELDGRIHP